MFSEMETAGPEPSERQVDIEQSTLGGPGLWLRAEPDDNSAQADSLAAVIALAMGDKS